MEQTGGPAGGRGNGTGSIAGTLRTGVLATVVPALLALTGGCSGPDGADAPETAAPAPAAAATAPQPLSTDEREAALNEIRRKRIEAAEQERAMREQIERERRELQASGGKCIDGRAYRKQGNEWQEVGPC